MKKFLKITLVLIVILGLAGVGWVTSKRLTMMATETFTISKQPEKPIVVVAMGDISCSPRVAKTETECRSEEVFEQVKKIAPDALLFLGDLQYESGSVDNFQNVFGSLIGDFKSKSWPAPGNHEYNTPGAVGYFDFWKDHPSFTLIKNSYYSTKLGEWKIISLDSNCSKIGGCSLNSKQGTWLNQDQATLDQPKCTLAFWHHPLFTFGRYNGSQDSLQTKPLWETLQATHVDLVLNGHDHVYERFAPQLADGSKNDKGIRQFTVGTGGRSLYKLTTKQPNQEFFTDKSFGFLKLDLYQHYYKWAFIDVNGQTLDQGTGACVA